MNKDVLDQDPKSWQDASTSQGAIDADSPNEPSNESHHAISGMKLGSARHHTNGKFVSRLTRAAGQRKAMENAK